METPRIKKTGISPIWILPVVAFIIGGWLLYKGVRDAGINIIVHFENAEGVAPGKTRVMYKGIPVGTVRETKVDPDMEGISLYIEMDSRTKDGLMEDTRFWLVRPQISAGRISGLQTILSGSHIEARRGVSKIASREFKGLSEPPPVSENAPGLHIKLKADALHSIQKGSRIYYKNISVGSVQEYVLKSDESVLIYAYIEPEYASLVKTETRFWNTSGITLKGDLGWFKLHMESLATLIYGGIGLYTPESKMDSPSAQNGRIFTLYPDFDDAGFGLDMSLQLLPSAESLKAGVTKVMYRGVEVGQVTDLRFNQDEKCTVVADIIINPNAEFILREKTRFWVVRPRLSINKIENLETLVGGAYIALEVGGGEFCNDFTIQEQPDSEEALMPGSRFALVSENAKSFSRGAPVLYKEIQVGEITGFNLAPDGNHVLAEIFIYEKYVQLVKSNSIFWKIGGIDVNAGLDGISVKTGTIISLLAGGVAFANPGTGHKAASAAHEKDSFILYESYPKAIDAVPALQQQGLIVHLQTSTLKSVPPGSPVLYKQIEVGKITGFHLEKNGHSIIFSAFIQKKYAHLLRTTCRFYNASGIDIEAGFSGVRLKTGSLKSIMAGGVVFWAPFEGKKVKAGHSFKLYDDYQTALDADKTEVIIRFAEPQGLKKDVEIRYQGITVGKVKKVRYGQGMDSIIAEALVNRDATSLFRKDTRIWLVTPEFSLSGVKHLDTLISGPYIAINPGQGSRCLDLQALDRPPLMEEVEEGLNIILETPSLGSLEKGSQVYYRQVQVGSVTGYKLSPTAREVWVYVNICTPYDALVRKNTKFWNVSGIRVDAGIFSGVDIDTESLESIIAGGIAMATPESDKAGSPVVGGHHFILHEKAHKKWLAWKPEIYLE
ncbi:MAG: MCE family protein [Deltaproteobacteria bacterium]|nr:MCE family protein [Deltaproteobacteria bacterium]